MSTTKEIREAAERIINYKYRDVFNDARTLATFALEQTAGDGELTPEWIREEWDSNFYNGEVRIEGFTGAFHFDEDDGALVWRHVGNVTASFTTRHQFRQLAQALGITPKRKESGLDENS